MNHLEHFLAHDGYNWLMAYAMRLTKRDRVLAEDLVQDILVWAAGADELYDITKGEYKKWLSMKLWGTWKRSFNENTYRSAEQGSAYVNRELPQPTHDQRRGFGHTTLAAEYTDQIGRETGAATVVLATMHDERDQMHKKDVAWALRQLTPKEQALITWHDIEGCTYEEISDRYRATFKKPMSKHRQRGYLMIQQVREKLRALLKDYAPEYERKRSPTQSGSTLTAILRAA